MSIGATMWRMCFGKQQHTEAEARQRAEGLNRNRRRRSKHVHPYRCEVCGAYHIGGNRHATKEIRRGGV